MNVALESPRLPHCTFDFCYPIVVAAMSFVVGLIFLPETKDRDITHI